MNEKIKELENRCWESNNYPPYGPPEFNKEKFAELIVQECYNIAYDGDGILEYFGIDK